MHWEEAWQQLKQQLEALYDASEAANIADWVMEALTGRPRREWLLLRELPPLDTLQQQQLQDYTKELLQFRPVQYVLGECYFFGMKLYVDENVLIPRPETEELADWAVKYLKQAGIDIPVVLDIGTGSGCLALAIKKSYPSAAVYAADLSEGALAVARRNATEQHLDITLLQMDILEETEWSRLPRPHLLISNPPYITPAERDSLLPNVLDYEPHEALFVTDNDPLQFYKIIARLASERLQPEGSVLLELHRDFAVPTQQHYSAQGWQTELRKDMQGADRMLLAKRPASRQATDT